MCRLLIVVISTISTMPLSAQGQQPDPAKLKADAQKVVSIISSDKAKTQTYCQLGIVDKIPAISSRLINSLIHNSAASRR